MSRQASDRFDDKVSPCPLTGCWWWTGCTTRGGYGQLRISGAQRRTDYAHRLSWERHHGPIPDGLWVLHHCDNPPCVNPTHLFLGTQTDNMRDMTEKGRRVGNALLTADDVREVRSRLVTGETQRSIAEAHGHWAGDRQQREDRRPLATCPLNSCVTGGSLRTVALSEVGPIRSGICREAYHP